MEIYGAIEAGGTKFVCAVGNAELEIVEKVSFPTETPQKTMAAVVDFFNRYKKELKSIGVGCFGPIDIQPNSAEYGYITTTPKLDWQYVDFVGILKRHFSVPIAWTTDVNAACYGEYLAGHGLAKRSVAYFTIGTGVGGGAIQDDRFVEGFGHPEMGHMLVRKHEADTYSGNCPFHGDCLEGLASGPAIAKRVKQKAEDIPVTDSSWDQVAYYVAQCAYNTTLMLSPDVIIFGGGVMKKPGLIEKVRDQFEQLMEKYVSYPSIEDYLVLPKLGDNAGTIGCLSLAKSAEPNS